MNKCAAVILSNMSDSFVALNEFQINDAAIEIINNKSLIYGNKIQKSNLTGIVVACTKPDADSVYSSPLIIRNYIEHSLHHGIRCDGLGAIAVIKANCIEQNKKVGILIQNGARAHIGGEGRDGDELKALLEAQKNQEVVGGPDDQHVKYQTLDYQADYEGQCMGNIGLYDFDSLGFYDALEIAVL